MRPRPRVSIRDVGVLEGPNIYSYQPVIVAAVDIGPLDDTPSKALPGFNDLLLSLLPGLSEHRCSRGEPGGFVQRMEEGTYMAHVVEHVTLELLHLAGMRSRYGTTRWTGHGASYTVAYEYEELHSGREAVAQAARLINRLLDLRDPEAIRACADPGWVERAVARVGKLRQALGPGPSTTAILQAAAARGIPAARIGEGSLLQLGYGANQKRAQAGMTSQTSCVAVDTVSDKALTKTLLAEFGLPVPEGEAVTSLGRARKVAGILGYPVAVKPVDCNQGKGVSARVEEPGELASAFRRARAFSRRVMVERSVPGCDFRVTVVGDRVVAVSERIPPSASGDGRRTVRDLVLEANADPRRGVDHELCLSRIPLDEIAIECLAKQGLVPESVPEKDRTVALRYSANLSTGAHAVDRTDEIHPANARYAIDAARILGLDVAGVDMVTPDITVPLEAAGGAVIEVNAAPGLRMHHYPSAGRPRDVAGAIVDMLFPNPRAARIPIVAVTGTNGKTTTVRMIAHMLRLTGLRVGMTTTDGVYVDNRRVREGDCAGPVSARRVLADPAVEAAVLEVARGGIIRRGLGYDASDVGVVTNLTGDHLGLDGVETLQQLSRVKSLVVECVRRDGFAVLNADDPFVVEMADRAVSRLAFFSMRPDSVVVRKHMHEGGNAVFFKNGALVMARGTKQRMLISVKDVAAGLGGRAVHNIQNAAAAACAGLCLAVAPDAIYEALASFACTPDQNPGRLNLIRLGDVQCIVDYGHNAAGFEAVIRTARSLKHRRLLGVVAVPGDRTDVAIRAAGQVAGSGFDRLVVKEDADRRGREPGEVARLITDGALAGGISASRLKVVLDEAGAVRAALDDACPGDVVVVFYEDMDLVMHAIRSWAQATSTPMSAEAAAVVDKIMTSRAPVRRTAQGT